MPLKSFGQKQKQTFKDVLDGSVECIELYTALSRAALIAC